MQLMLPDPSGDPSAQPGATVDDTDADLLRILSAYKSEAEEARREGPNGRDRVWEQNWDLYWGRMDYSAKADWQSQEVMPEAPQYVDRWASAMREALNQPGRWFAADDPGDQDNAMAPHIEKFLDVLLTTAGSTPDGHPAEFGAVFEDLMKLGAIMSIALTVTWKPGRGPGGGQVTVEPVDPRTVWLDGTGRGLYRLRSYEIDKHVLEKRARQVDAEGQPIYRPEAVAALNRDERQEREAERETSTGHVHRQTSPRQPVQIDEWLATVVDNDGTVLADEQLIVVANDRAIVRGPEDNPFWHGNDWLVTASMVTVPLSVYGRSYMEDWVSIARAFIELTNLIMDATYFTSINAFSAVVDMLEDPAQLQEGVVPGKVFELESDSDARQFIEQIQLGEFPVGAVTVWQGIKSELREGAKLSEISLGQVPPKGDITATEISEVSQSSSSIVRSMARTVESRVLEPTLELIFQTGLQHVDFNDPRLRAELGKETCNMLAYRKKDFRERQIRFRVNGISSLIDRQVKLRNLLGALNTIGQSEILLQEFLQRYDFGKVMGEILRLYGVDTAELELTDRERQLRAIVKRSQAMAAAAQGGQEAGAGGGQGSPRRTRQPAQAAGGGMSQ